ncbi:phosphate ABC transporter permease subunit PstC [Enterococcus timonensis]|uniref:phosphate ABC transporter permease subunit PstC n=1 Tax=Enterococcus timonensis TaxID=1852364 RepID=UPI0008DA7556|nr:phosphate ABC transporter permease subunit PstC [Enterococcus timonensis]
MREKSFKAIFFASALIAVLSLTLISVFLLMNGVPAVEKVGLTKVLTGVDWHPAQNLYGILPMILGTLYVTGGALLLSVPTGILGAVFLAFFCPPKIYPFFKQMVALMAGIPSILYGLFGLVVLVPLIQPFNGSGKGLFTAALLLGLMILPTIMTVSEDALQMVPESYYEGSIALGASHERTVFSVMVPAAKSGITAGVVLGMGRGIGETMAVVMVAGNQAILPSGLFSGVRTLTTNIVMEMGYATDLHRAMLIATGFFLFFLILLINVIFTLFKERGRQNGYY